MVFSSSLFLVYFLPLFLAAYYLTPSRFRNWTALVGSTAFYAWGAPLFVFVVYASLFIDFWLVAQIDKSTSKSKYVASSVLLNVGLLAYFKYSNFFVGNFNGFLEIIGLNAVGWSEVALPIGISFFTFQKLSYTLDVYKGKHASLKSFGDYALYIILFPQLIAGPIVRFNEIADQLTDRKSRENVNHRLLGFFRFTIGLGKKVLIANVVGTAADAAFSINPNDLTTGWAWVGILAYTMQIYFDFSGYSDMAIGLGRMMGFKFPENFNNPYISSSITEFWRRWHMTLSRWMKDYLYIPLGGNQLGVGRTYFNLWAVFLLSGLWHGASWTFVIWGAYHGLFLVMERLFLGKFQKAIGRFPSMLFTFFIAMLGWVLFRADSINHATSYYVALFDFNRELGLPDLGTEFNLMFAFALIFSFVGFFPAVEKLQQNALGNAKLEGIKLIFRTLASLLLFLFCLSMINASGFNPFIYFRF